MDRISVGNVEYTLIIMNPYNGLPLNSHRFADFIDTFKLDKLVLETDVENKATY